MSTTNILLLSSPTLGHAKTVLLECQICEVPAQYSYFGVIACQPCRMFFRRNANAKQNAVQCHFDGHCEININTRHLCSYCRLAKCFQCGMTTEKFRSSVQTNCKTKTLVNVQEQKQPERLPTINLLQSDQSSLTTNQWTLLSNLYNTYNESQLLLLGKRLIDTHNTLQPTNVIYQNLIQEFISAAYDTAGRYLCLNDDFRRLLFNDHSVLLLNAASNVTCMGSAFVLHELNLLDLCIFSETIKRIYGNHTVALLLWAREFIDQDLVVFRLALSLFAISEQTYSDSPNSSTHITDSMTIFHIQNKYVEILWRYLIYKYGSIEAVRRFLNLMSWLMALTILMIHAQSITIHVRDIHSLVEQIELTLVLDDTDRIVETNQD